MLLPVLILGPSLIWLQDTPSDIHLLQLNISDKIEKGKHVTWSDNETKSISYESSSIIIYLKYSTNILILRLCESVRQSKTGLVGLSDTETD